MSKRKVSGQENVQLPSIAAILNENPAPKRAKTAAASKKTAVPLADISNSPAPITWTAFPVPQLPSLDAVKAVEQPAAAPTGKKAAPKAKAAAKPKAAATAKPAKKNTKAAPLPDNIAAIHLPGEETDTVPVYDTCDVIRRKITTALSGDHTKASLLRALAACTSDPTRAIPATSFQHFMSAKGRTGGSKSRIFYAAYVYFEKLRIAEGKKKTKSRIEMEEAWGDAGMDYMNIGRPILVSNDEDIQIDRYGREVVIRADGSMMHMLGEFSKRPF
ncbi:hypothetical protein TWF696_005562 [Orbilia brochopaga]|uniref:DUF7726 domain-containing protein n=1 Tax=Orbilia brochopaga TaxID=3140254 RepID=A0AAV9V2E8_9PEZI